MKYPLFLLSILFFITSSCSSNKNQKPNGSSNIQTTSSEIAVFDYDKVKIEGEDPNNIVYSEKKDGWWMVIVGEEEKITIYYKGVSEHTKKEFILKKGSKIICDNKVIRIISEK